MPVEKLVWPGWAAVPLTVVPVGLLTWLWGPTVLVLWVCCGLLTVRPVRASRRGCARRRSGVSSTCGRRSLSSGEGTLV
jgi:hypothetical protein